MLFIPKINNYLKMLTAAKVKDFVAINFSEYFKSTREKVYSKLSEEQNLKKVAESLHIFLTTHDEVEKYAKIIQLNSPDKYVRRHNIGILNLFYPKLQLINNKILIKNKLKELKIIHSSINLIASDLNFDEAFPSMHQSIISKIKNYASED